MTCYYPDGAVAEGLQPCNTTAGAVSSCCRVGDVCLTNGFCFSAGQNSLVRRGCTDSTFNSTECPRICITGAVSSVDVVMTPCGDYTYFCCGQDNAARSCCTSRNGTVLLAAGTAILPTSPTGCPLDNSTAASNINQSAKSTVPISAVAGLGVVSGVALIILAVLVVMWRKKADRANEAEQRVMDVQQRIREAEQLIMEKDQRVMDVQQRISEAEQLIMEKDQRVMDVQQRISEAEQLIKEKDQRIEDLKPFERKAGLIGP
ncbi:hypothetical protein BGZ57DRAFT_119381 [Hyaloscypha finlandica]|nr:hypothetical protein BGZ57DRAFT_119381 [Hyaloscypha finlandica]